MLLSGWYSRVFLWERFCLFVFVLFPYSSRYNNSLWECFQIILVSYAVCAVWKGKCLQTCLDVPDNVGLVLQWDSLGGTQIEFQWVRQELGKIWWTVLIWRAFRFLALRIKKTKHLSPAPPPPPPPNPDVIHTRYLQKYLFLFGHPDFPSLRNMSRNEWKW